MRFWGWILGFGALTILGANPAAAQSPPAVERTDPLDGVLPACPPPVPFVTVDFILGLPTGFRIQRALADDRLWHLEGFAGLELIFPIAGGGIRRRYEPFCGRSDALVIAPGVDAYLLFNTLYNSDGFLIGGGPALGLAVTLDVDVLWRHSFTERCQGQLGFKVGGGAGYGARWAPLPVAGVFTGMRW